jgi:hypothetical protein
MSQFLAAIQADATYAGAILWATGTAGNLAPTGQPTGAELTALQALLTSLGAMVALTALNTRAHNEALVTNWTKTLAVAFQLVG